MKLLFNLEVIEPRAAVAESRIAIQDTADRVTGIERRQVFIKAYVILVEVPDRAHVLVDERDANFCLDRLKVAIECDFGEAVVHVIYLGVEIDEFIGRTIYTIDKWRCQERRRESTFDGRRPVLETGREGIAQVIICNQG